MSEERVEGDKKQKMYRGEAKQENAEPAVFTHVVVCVCVCVMKLWPASGCS